MNNFKHFERQNVMIWSDICEDQTTDLIEFKKILKRVKRDKKKNVFKNSIIVIDYINQILKSCVLL